MSSHPAHKTSPGRPRSLQSEESILKATIDLLSEVGYQAMSIEAIASRAGVGKTTIYRWYDSKDELVLDALNRRCVEIEPPDTGNLRKDVQAVIKEAVRSLPQGLE